MSWFETSAFARDTGDAVSSRMACLLSLTERKNKSLKCLPKRMQESRSYFVVIPSEDETEKFGNFVLVTNS